MGHRVLWQIIAGSLLVGIGLIVVSCVRKDTSREVSPIIRECVLPADQASSLHGRWQAIPVPIALKKGDFQPDEVRAIIKAADVWNKFFQESIGSKIIDYGDAAAPSLSDAAKPAKLCAGKIVRDGSFSGQVVIYKQTTWPSANLNAIAQTSYCPSPGGQLPNYYTAIIEVNYQEFFVPGKRLPDLTSIFVHEFGHLIGLDHSCDTTGRAGIPQCADSGVSQEYFDAVMYPEVSMDLLGAGEIRTTLQANDQSRANCLYPSKKSR